MELGLAIYGAVIGTAALGFGIFQWRRSRRPDVTVGFGEMRDASGDFVQVWVVNRGSHPVRVECYGFQRPGEKLTGVWYPDDDLPIPPSDAMAFSASLSELRGGPGIPFAAWVRLTTGDEFSSKLWYPFGV